MSVVKNRLRLVETIAISSGVGSTIIVNPWFQLDPINMPKMFVVASIAAFLSPWVLVSTMQTTHLERFVFLTSYLFILTLIYSVIKNEAPKTQQIWGTWGRSTGLITYSALVVVLLSCVLLSSDSFRISARLTFERVGYIVAAYAVLQWAELDPIDWSQKALVSTLGNINFMSSLLGLASISYFSRILFGKLSIPSRIYYVLVIAVNLLLISVSGSIQGIGVFAAGAVLVLAFFIRENKSLSASLAFLFASTSTGVIGLLGTASVGPLKSIGQETVTFRLDYWKAAIKMTLENPWYGVGLDSYGDFYRLYRDEAAILRTGPQRVTNTAHNIFLDVSSGAGLFSLLLFTTLFLVAFYIVGRALIQNSFDKDSITWAALSLGFAVFCLISINQIGVGIWGFIGIGIIIGTGKEVFQQREVLDASHKVLSKSRIKQGSKNKNKFSYNTSKSSGEGWTFTRRLPKFLESTQLLCAVFIMVIAGQQVFIDSLLLKSLRTGDFESAYKISFSQSAHDQQRDITIAKLKDSKREIPALNLARRATEINPRNWDAWVFIISSNLSTDEEKKTAAETLLELDPKNNLVREELSSLFP